MVSRRYLADTNVISEPLKPAPAPSVLRQLQQHEAAIHLAAPVWHELIYGAQRLPPSKRRHRIERYLATVVYSSFPILPYDETAAEWHARERARLSKSGKTPSFVDGQIAAIAKTNGMILVTANRRHFEVFEDLELEDWTSR